MLYYTYCQLCFHDVRNFTPRVRNFKVYEGCRAVSCRLIVNKFFYFSSPKARSPQAGSWNTSWLGLFEGFFTMFNVDFD